MTTETSNVFAAIATIDAAAAVRLARAAVVATDRYEMFAVLRYIYRTEHKALFGWFDGGVCEDRGFPNERLSNHETFVALQDDAHAYLDSLKAASGDAGR